MRQRNFIVAAYFVENGMERASRPMPWSNS